MFCSQTSSCCIGLVGLPFFKFDEIRLRWVFTVKTTVILLKNVFEFMFNRARSTFHRSRLFEVLGERVLISELSQCVGLVITLWPCALKVLSSVMSSPCFCFSLLFFFSFFF